MFSAIFEGWIIGGLLGAIILMSCVFAVRPFLADKASNKVDKWSLVSAILILSWAVLLLIEAFWWFWTSELVHRIVMFAGGCFGLYWGILYIVLRKK